MVEIVPSILSADFARLADEIARVEAAGVTMLHLDVMDGHFVPNITIGPPVVKSVRKATRLTLDVHLMIENPDQHIPEFIDAGANQISVHQETCRHLDRTLRLIQSLGGRAGVVLNPATPVAALDCVLEVADYVLLMTVNPGFGGQEFIPYGVRKIRELDHRRQALGATLPIEIDGGVSLDNLAELVRAGANWIVTGSKIFHSGDPTATVAEMMRVAREATAVRV
ncbi:MAG: ribulose-phosphate 3-epimerase [Bryobacteraceae bacterium]|nr:ribulose-phosphate 3-epimerase [Bryobacteraceae bacterium]